VANRSSNTLRSLIDEYEQSPGLILYRFISNGETLLGAHSENYNDLIVLINDYDTKVQEATPKPGRIVSPNHVDAKSHLKTFLRLMHNYCASLYTLDQNYNDFLNKSKYGDPFDKEIGKLLGEFRLTPKNLFFFALRNYYTHHRIPAFKVSVSSRRDDNDLMSVRGKFTISKSFFNSDFNKTIWTEEPEHTSKLIERPDMLRILSHYISHDAADGSSIEITDVVVEFQKELALCYENINDTLIAKYRNNYSRTKSLITEILKRQEALD